MKNKERMTGQSTRVKLYFDGGGLYRVAFSHPLLASELISIRGKTGNRHNDFRSFQWTSAVKGLALLLVETRLYALSPAAKNKNFSAITGGQGSLAASLDYAINKKPSWLQQMFGLDKRGQSLVARIIHRENPLRRRGEKVSLSINLASLAPENISVQVRGHEADTVALQSLHEDLLSSEKGAGGLTEREMMAAFQSTLEEEIRLSLAANDIFSEPKLNQTLKKFESSCSFTRLTGGLKYSPSRIDQSLSPDERLGLRPFDRTMLEKHPLHVAAAIGHVASLALITFIRHEEGIPIELDLAHAHSSGLAEAALRGEDLPPILCLSQAPAAKLIGLSVKSNYRPLMMLPSQRICLVERTTANPTSNAIEYVLLTGEFSTAQMVLEQLRTRGELPKKFKTQHVEPHEILSGFEQSDSTCRSILGFPYYFFVTTLLARVRFLDLPPGLVWKETFLFAHKSLFEQPALLKALDMAVRNAWLTLLENSKARARTARALSNTPGFMRTLTRHAGIVNWKAA